MKRKNVELISFVMLFVLSLVAIFNIGKVSAPPADVRLHVNPPSVVDTGLVSGSKFSVDINVDDVPETAELFAYEFYLGWNPSTLLSYPVEPLVNPNFTDVSTWAVTKTVTSGTASDGYDTGDGNPSLGSGAPSYFVRATSTDSATANIVFIVKQSFDWDFGMPMAASLSFAYRISGNAIDMAGSLMSIRVKDPVGGTSTLIPSKYFTALNTGISSWSYNVTETSVASFGLTGTYEFQLRTVLKTNAVGASNYVQVNWDDVGLSLAPISVAEGSFLSKGGTQTTYFVAKYFEQGYVYIANTLTGTPYIDVDPVNGSGTLATVTFYVEGTGNTPLDLYATKLRTPGLPPDYPPVPIDHETDDGFFMNIDSVQLNYEVSAGGTTAIIGVETNSSVSDFALNETELMVSFNVTGPSGTTGFCNVTIPLDFMQGPWTITIDDEFVTDQPSTNTTHTLISLTYSLSTRLIRIKAVWIVPEFPASTLLPIILLVTSVAVILGRRAWSKNRRGHPVAN